MRSLRVHYSQDLMSSISFLHPGEIQQLFKHPFVIHSISPMEGDHLTASSKIESESVLFSIVGSPSPIKTRHSIQVNQNQHIGSASSLDQWMFVNHHCDFNVSLEVAQLPNGYYWLVFIALKYI